MSSVLSSATSTDPARKHRVGNTDVVTHALHAAAVDLDVRHGAPPDSRPPPRQHIPPPLGCKSPAIVRLDHSKFFQLTQGLLNAHLAYSQARGGSEIIKNAAAMLSHVFQHQFFIRGRYEIAGDYLDVRQCMSDKEKPYDKCKSDTKPNDALTARVRDGLGHPMRDCGNPVGQGSSDCAHLTERPADGGQNAGEN